MKVYAYKTLKWLLITGLFLFLTFLVFISSPSLLQTFSFMLLILCVGVMLDSRGSIFCKVLKWIIYILYFLYTIYNLGIFIDFQSLTLEDYNKILFGVIAPLCMVIVAKIITSRRIKGFQIFNFYVFMVIYLVIAFIWDFFFPEEVIIEFIVIYWVFLLMISYYSKNNTKNVGGN